MVSLQPQKAEGKTSGNFLWLCLYLCIMTLNSECHVSSFYLSFYFFAILSTLSNFNRLFVQLLDPYPHFTLSLSLSELLKSTDFCLLPVASQVWTFHQWPWDLHINYAFGLLLQRSFIGYSQVSGFVVQGIFAFGDLGLYCCSRMGSSDEKVVAVIMVGGPTKGMKLLWSLDPTMRPFSSFLWILVIVLWILVAKSNTLCNNGTQFLLL